MSEFFEALTTEHSAFIGRQSIFFVATAAADARINLSPKGMDSFHILSPGRVAYLDVGGSGNETMPIWPPTVGSPSCSAPLTVRR